MDYSKFQAVYANIPEKLRKDIVAVVDGKPYTWDAAYFEIKSQTKLGKIIYDKLLKMEII